MKTLLSILLLVFLELTATACIWDADTLSQEQHKSPDVAKVILGTATEPENPQRLQERIKDLEADRHENDPEWWNNLAGAYIRLNQLETAIKILEPLREKFPDDYGIHANLGTAYHLAGRYQEAEKEISRDLEINPDAHFGLEKYHLSLLQYLIRDSKYQLRHIYLDEFTEPLFTRGIFIYPTDGLETNSERTLTPEWKAESEMAADEYSILIRSKTTGRNLHDVSNRIFVLLNEMGRLDPVPEYREKWNLGHDSKLDEGVMYMATLNPKEPACFVMLGAVCLKNRDLNLAAAAFEKAVQLHSLQSDWLQFKIAEIKGHIREAQNQRHETSAAIVLVGILLLIGVVAIFFVIRKISAMVSRKQP